MKINFDKDKDDVMAEISDHFFDFLNKNERQKKPRTRGITEIAARFINALGLENLMFEAADPKVFAWYIRNYGPEVNLFVDHSQIVQLEALRQGIWGTKSLWGRVLTHKG